MKRAIKQWTSWRKMHITNWNSPRKVKMGAINQNTFTTVGAEVYIQGVRMNGNMGQQIKEQAQTERAKKEAKTKPQQWGQNTNEVDWKEMLRTCKNKTIADRKGMMLDMWNGK